MEEPFYVLCLVSFLSFRKLTMKQTLNKLFSAIVSFLFLAVIFTTCHVEKTPHILNGYAEHGCNPNNNPANVQDVKVGTFDPGSLDADLRLIFSPASLKVAHAIGILPELEKLVKDKAFNEKPTVPDKKAERLARLQFIHQRIMQSWLEVSSAAGEMDCEEERADQIATFLKNKEDAFETRLTAASIVLGAAGGLASGLLLVQDAGGSATEMVGIGTGLAGTVLGILILSHKKKTEFYHPHNALKDIWEGPTHSVFFPSAIWYYLNYKDSINSKKSLREELKERWISFGQIDTSASARAKKMRQQMFGQGGRYTAEQLSNRANMYDQLESVINLMKKDLKTLMHDLEKMYE